MNYESATDKELNQALTGIIFGLDNWELTNSGWYFFMEDAKGEQHVVSVIDYCTDWNATMPLAVEHGVSLSFDGIDWEANQDWMGGNYIRAYNNIEHHAGKPLRAIVICLIKVLEAKQ